jgi:hypothetical protein
LEDNSNSSNPHNYSLSSLLGLKHDELYVILMQKCGLIRLEPKTKGFIASINCIRNGLGYTWSGFFIKFNLDVEVSHLYQDKKKVYFVHVGIFKEGTERFTVWDQIQKCTSLEFQHGIRAAQKALIKGVAYESMEPLSLSSCFSSEALSVGDLTEKGLKEQNQPMSDALLCG